ncbi:MAG: hypothetical protein LBF93_04135 [Zoogloeaceae bacterium]|jgi:hypothetical protein|nr:hypothetical protein [Zoogloeaceae bacterium]
MENKVFEMFTLGAANRNEACHIEPCAVFEGGDDCRLFSGAEHGIGLQRIG